VRHWTSLLFEGGRKRERGSEAGRDEEGGRREKDRKVDEAG